MTTSTTPIRAPGPRGTWLLGSLSEFRRDPMGLLMRVTAQYGDVVRLRFGPITAHVINHPDYVGQVLEERYQNYDKRTRSTNKMRATCGASLLTEDGPLWLRHRRLIQPVLTRQAVSRYIPIVTEATASMLAHWGEATRSSRPLEIVSEMMRLTLEIAARVLFGADISRDTALIEQSLAEILADTWRRVENVVDWSAVSPAFHRHSFLHAVNRIDEVVYRLIETRRKNPGNASDLLSALLDVRDPDSGRGLTDTELRDITITMLLAGHETTANALAWTLSQIFRSPAVEKELVREVQSVVGDRVPGENDLEQLEWTRMTFAETIRLFPSIWIIERRVVEEDVIGGFVVPAGSMLLLSPYVMHRDPRYWDEPERFLPERFSIAQTVNRPKHAYIPFGAGPHQCIGRFLAPLVAQLIIAMVVSQFRLMPIGPADPVPLPGITLRFANGLEMVPHLRQSQ